jgi:glutamate racemase
MKYAVEIAELLMDRGAKMLVVACNTATSVALDELRARYEVPVIGVVEPALRAAAKVTAARRIGVIGTVGTIASGAYQQAAASISPPVEVVCQACPGFVEFVEAGDVDSDQVYVLAERLLAPVAAAGVDALVLGCTHYPLLARTISTIMGRDVTLVSSADETAFEVRSILASAGLSSPGNGEPVRRAFVTSGDPGTFRLLGSRFLGPEVTNVEAWQWS